MAKETPTATEKDLEAQIQELKKELLSVTDQLSNFSSEKMAQAKGQAEQFYASAKANGEEVISQAKEKFNDMGSQINDCLREKPVASLAVAAGVGFLLAMLIRR